MALVDCLPFCTRSVVCTVRFCDVREGLNDTAENLLSSIKRDESEISASTVFAVASILEGCCYINGSPQNTFVPGVLGLAQEHNVHIGKCRRRLSACSYMNMYLARSLRNISRTARFSKTQSNFRAIERLNKFVLIRTAQTTCPSLKCTVAISEFILLLQLAMISSRDRPS